MTPVIHRSQCWDLEEERESSLSLVVCSPSAPCFPCLKFTSTPKGKIDWYGDKGWTNQPSWLLLLVLPEEACGSSQVAEEPRGRRGGSTPQRAAAPSRPAGLLLLVPSSRCPASQPRTSVCPAGPGTPGGQELHFGLPCIPLRAQLVWSRATPRTGDPLGGARLTTPLGTLSFSLVYRAPGSQVLVCSANSRHMENSY